MASDLGHPGHGKLGNHGTTPSNFSGTIPVDPLHGQIQYLEFTYRLKFPLTLKPIMEMFSWLVRDMSERGQEGHPAEVSQGDILPPHIS